jgi:hypothetical protein
VLQNDAASQDQSQDMHGAGPEVSDEVLPRPEIIDNPQPEPLEPYVIGGTVAVPRADTLSQFAHDKSGAEYYRDFELNIIEY